MPPNCARRRFRMKVPPLAQESSSWAAACPGIVPGAIAATLDGELETHVANLQDRARGDGHRLCDRLLVHQRAIAAAEIFYPERAIFVEDAGVLGRDEGAVEHDRVSGRAANRRDGLDIQARARNERGRAAVDHYEMPDHLLGPRR